VCVCVLNFYDFIIPKFKPFVRSPSSPSSLSRRRRQVGAKEKALRDLAQPRVRASRIVSGGELGVVAESGWLVVE
jgi:hypothetical protein